MSLRAFFPDTERQDGVRSNLPINGKTSSMRFSHLIGDCLPLRGTRRREELLAFGVLRDPRNDMILLEIATIR